MRKFTEFLGKLKTNTNRELIETIEQGYFGIFETYNIYVNNPNNSPQARMDMITETSDKTKKKKKKRKK